MTLVCHKSSVFSTVRYAVPFSRTSYFRKRTDYIFIPVGCPPLPTTRWHLVVEPSPVRGLAADCPILLIFKHSHLGLFHPYAVVQQTLRVFQTVQGVFIQSHCCESGLLCQPGIYVLAESASVVVSKEVFCPVTDGKSLIATAVVGEFAPYLKVVAYVEIAIVNYPLWCHRYIVCE